MNSEDLLISRLMKRDIKRQNLFSSSSAPWQQKIIRDFINESDLSSKIEVLDAASGIGNNIRTLLDFNFNVYGVDKRNSALIFARKRYEKECLSGEVRFKLANLQDLPFDGEYFDLVVCTEALEHVKNLQKVLDEICRVLKPGGFLILSFQNYLNLAIVMKFISEQVKGKNWDAWGTHGYNGAYESSLTYFQVKKVLNKNKSIEIIKIRGADYINAWAGWVPGLRKNYFILDRFPLFFLGRLPLVNILGMDCFILASKKRD